jgi:RimJ/RimL family protein N-acetyltransferase
MTIPPPGPPLTADALARSKALPHKMDPVTLSGTVVELTPLDLARDAAASTPSRTASPRPSARGRSARMTRRRRSGASCSPGRSPTRRRWQDYLRGQVEVANGLCLCVRDRATGAPIGVVNYMNNFPEHLKVELGGIWYSPLAQRTDANLEATTLLLRRAFDLGYRRVEWKCDALNGRSRRAAERMGFRFEGIQEAHFIIKGRNRDTAWFRILDREWPDVRARLERLLAAR